MFWTISTVVLACVVGVLIVYIKNFLKMYSSIIDEFLELREELFSFHFRLKKVYKMDLYYGDETLRSLIKHLDVLSVKVEDFLEAIVIEDYEKDEDEESDEDEEELLL